MRRAPLLFSLVVACSGPSHALIPVDPSVGGGTQPSDETATPDAGAAEVPAKNALAAKYQADVQKIVDAALADDGGWAKLEWLCDRIGNRISGSKALEEAVAWAVDTMKKDGHENVAAEPVKVPHWVRGNESAELVAPVKRKLHMLGLGLSVGTPKNGITADVVVVRTKEELEALGDEVKGKIVLFDNAMPKWTEAEGSGYGKTVVFRGAGPTMAAKQGAVAVLVRSVTARSLRSPHTGMTDYDDPKVTKIPGAAISVEDAELIARLAAAGETPRVTLRMEAKMLADADSANVIAELRGREKPDEIVVIGGHLDSWDVGQGAHDDGGGVVVAMEALTVLRKLKMQPRRTIRVVLYTNEENGIRGALAYMKAHAAEMPKHVAGIEADSGTFAPWGFTVGEKTEQAGIDYVRALAGALAPIGATKIEVSGSGVDVAVSIGKGGAPAILLGLGVDGSTYFDYHHSDADTLDKVDPEMLRQDVAAMAAMAWMLAEDDSR